MEKSARPNRIREALGQLHDQQPPYFREYLRRFQEDPTSRVFAPLAEAYRRLGRFEDAIAICLEGLEHHPDFHGGRVVLAKCYLGKNAVNEAKRELERVVHAVPENLLGQRLLGDANLALGNKAVALHCYKMALLMAPTDVALAEKVHELEAGATVLVGVEMANVKPLAALPATPEELEREIPPLWIEPTAPVDKVETTIDIVAEPLALSDSMPMGLQTLMTDDGNPIDDEAFKIGSVSSVFEETHEPSRKEITTETLGDLYFTQGQFDKAIRIFEKLKPTPILQKKIQACRASLGVDPQGLKRAKQIEFLRAVVQKARDIA